MRFIPLVRNAYSTSRGVVSRRPSFRPTIFQNLHTSKVQSKNQSKETRDDEDAFAIEEDDELIPVSNDAQPATFVSNAISRPAKLAASHARQFQKAKQELLEHPGYAAYVRWQEQTSNGASESAEAAAEKHAKATHPPRRATLAHLITHAGTRAELLEIVDVFSVYRNKKWPVDELNRIDFIGRCITLKSPDIALAVLYHRPLFGIDLTSISTGRALLHSLLWTAYPPSDTPLPEHLALPTSTPFTHALLLANLFDRYALPPVESDRVARALLLGGCANHEIKDDIDEADVVTVTRIVREWIEGEKKFAGKGVFLPGGTGVRGKLFRSVMAIKKKGKVQLDRKIFPVTRRPLLSSQDARFLYTHQLATHERTWIRRSVESFIEWAKAKGEDVAWAEKLRPQET